MFVDIEEFKSALMVENMLTPYKKGLVIKGIRQPKQKITPDACWEVLKSTNYKRNILDMLNCIKELPVEEQVLFKDVVLACFDNREQPSNIMVLGKKWLLSVITRQNLGKFAKFMRAYIFIQIPVLKKN